MGDWQKELDDFLVNVEHQRERQQKAAEELPQAVDEFTKTTILPVLEEIAAYFRARGDTVDVEGTEREAGLLWGALISIQHQEDMPVLHYCVNVIGTEVRLSSGKVGALPDTLPALLGAMGSVSSEDVRSAIISRYKDEYSEYRLGKA